jgi:hypothetical protein
MDFEKLRAGLTEIVQVCDAMPERFKDRCFEALLGALLTDTGSRTAALQHRETSPVPESSADTLPPLKGAMRVFLQRTKLSEDVLARAISYVDGQVHFLKEPAPGALSQGQIEWSLLSALVSAIDNNTFTVDGAEVRQLCEDKGFLDASNFWAIFGRSSKLFSKPITKADPRQTLNAEGQAELARLLETLAS